MHYRPRVAALNEVTIQREGDTAIITFNDSESGGINLKFDFPVTSMTDLEILERHNEIVRFQLESAAQWRPTEIAEGRPQIKFDNKFRAWSAEGHVLRCVVGSDPERDETMIGIDNHELSLDEFGKLIAPFEGWGMRIVFVSEDQLCDPPLPEVRKAPKRISKKVLDELATSEAQKSLR